MTLWTGRMGRGTGEVYEGVKGIGITGDVADPYEAVAQASRVEVPRCPLGVGRRIGHSGHHVLSAVAVEGLRQCVGGGVTECERCRTLIYVPSV